MSKYPEHDKMNDLNGQNQVIGRFMKWLEEKDIILRKDELAYRWEEAICIYFGIDEDAFEEEYESMTSGERLSNGYSGLSEWFDKNIKDKS